MATISNNDFEADHVLLANACSKSTIRKVIIVDFKLVFAFKVAYWITYVIHTLLRTFILADESDYGFWKSGYARSIW